MWRPPSGGPTRDSFDPKQGGPLAMTTRCWISGGLAVILAVATTSMAVADHYSVRGARGAVAHGEHGTVAVGRRGAVAVGEEGHGAAVGRRGAVVVGEEGAAAVGRYGGVVVGERYEDHDGWKVAA